MGRTASFIARSGIVVGALASALTPLAAAAQAGSGPPIRDAPYPQQGPYPQGAQPLPSAPPPEPPPPPGYDGRELPPPPPGYDSTPAADPNADNRYAWEAERWARENCVKPRKDVSGGVIAGSILGAILGSAVAGRGDHGAGAAVGALFGAGAGAAVASGSDDDTSPGCPPGYVVRRGAADYAYAPSDYAYAAPGWYRPWVYVGGLWAFRPYPYHGCYARTYRGPGWRSGFARPYPHYHGGHGHRW